jgi:hypothetical protein
LLPEHRQFTLGTGLRELVGLCCCLGEGHAARHSTRRG